MRYQVTTVQWDEFGELPITQIDGAIPTILPPDDVIIESTEISGKPAFEELVNLDSIVNLVDPLKDRLIELIKAAGGEIPS